MPKRFTSALSAAICIVCRSRPRHAPTVQYVAEEGELIYLWDVIDNGGTKISTRTWHPHHSLLV